MPPWNVTEEWNKQFYSGMQNHDYEKDPFAVPKRCGVIGVKVGMTALWDVWGYRHALTAI